MISDEQYIERSQKLISDLSKEIGQIREKLNEKNDGSCGPSLAFIDEKEISFDQPSNGLSESYTRLNYLEQKVNNLTITLKQSDASKKALFEFIQAEAKMIEHDLKRI